MSAPPLSLDRFSALAEAYGADINRWPPTDRAAAQELAQQSPMARAYLAQADGLDAMLDLSRVAAPSAELRHRILAQAPRPRAASARAKLLRWLSGLGAIGILTCGAIAGAAVIAVSAPHLDADSVAGLYDQANGLDTGGA